MDHPPPYHHASGADSPDFQTGLFGCCSPADVCLLGTFLPCVLVGQTSARMHDPSLEHHEPINSDCLLMSFMTVTGLGWAYGMIKRGQIRRRYGMEPRGCSDCCVSLWCGCCALVQQEKEVMTRNRNAGGGGYAAVEGEGYRAETRGMVAEPGAREGGGKS